MPLITDPKEEVKKVDVDAVRELQERSLQRLSNKQAIVVEAKK